jgi:hypothetical protein
MKDTIPWILSGLLVLVYWAVGSYVTCIVLELVK